MKTKVLIDTNILIYGYDNHSPYHKQASNFLRDINYNFYTTTKNITEYFAVLSKLNAPLGDVWLFYEDIKRNIDLLFPNNYSLQILETLLKKYQPKGNKVFDFEIASIGLAHQVNTIATVNVKDFSHISEIMTINI